MIKKSFYLASRFEEAPKLRRIRDEILLPMGHTVTSRWLDQEKRREHDLYSRDWCRFHRECAYIDLYDLNNADVAILDLTFDPAGYMTYGAFTEIGYCLGIGKTVWVVGRHPNIFLLLPNCRPYPNWEELLLELGGPNALVPEPAGEWSFLRG